MEEEWEGRDACSTIDSSKARGSDGAVVRYRCGASMPARRPVRTGPNRSASMCTSASPPRRSGPGPGRRRDDGCSRIQLGPQPVVERPAPQGQTLSHDAEAPAVVEGDGGVEAPSAVELHPGPEPVRARGHRGSESADAGHRVHPADDQRQPLPGHGVSPHEVRGDVESEHPGGFADAAGRQVASLARRQVGGPVGSPSRRCPLPTGRPGLGAP